MHAVGALIAEVQAIAPGPLASLPPQWDAFLAAQIEGCRRRHERLGLPPHLLAQLEPYLQRTGGVLPAAMRPENPHR